MLVLKRKVGESIIIDNQIEVKILGDCNDKREGIRVGIAAPKDMDIIKAENRNRQQITRNLKSSFANSR